MINMNMHLKRKLTWQLCDSFKITKVFDKNVQNKSYCLHPTNVLFHTITVIPFKTNKIKVKECIVNESFKVDYK